jgi:hypothetical protein
MRREAQHEISRRQQGAQKKAGGLIAAFSRMRPIRNASAAFAP